MGNDIPFATSVLDNIDRDVYILTTAFEGDYAGQTITWLTMGSLTPEKKRVIGCISKFNDTYEKLKQSNVVCVNLPTKAQNDLAYQFGSFSGKDINKFELISQFDFSGEIPVIKETCGYSIVEINQWVELEERVLWVGFVKEEVFRKEKLIERLTLDYFMQNTDREKLKDHRKRVKGWIERDMKLF